MSVSHLVLKNITVLFLLFVSACSGGLLSDTRLDDALVMGRRAGLSPSWVRAKPFTLLSQIKKTDSTAPLRLYIEGDGFAYMAPGRPSVDPSPIKPVALTLATLDPAPNVAWLARPCQYVMLSGRQNSCAQKYWTTHRMARNVIKSFNTAINRIMKKTGATQLELVGYSGGGSIAALVAAKRDDVVALRTVAGNIDNAAFIRHHDLSPMPQSLDAKDFVSSLKDIPQVHFVGADDEVVLPFLSDAFVRAVGTHAKKVVVPNASHSYGWGKVWKELLLTELP